MISRENIKYSLKNLVKRKGRSSLTIISILIGISTIFIFLSFGLGLYFYVNGFVTGSTADKVTISPKGIGVPGLDDTFALSDADLKAVQRTVGVYDASGLVYKTAEVQQGKIKKFTFLVASDPEKRLLEEFSNIEIINGRGLRKNDQGNVVLGYNYMIDDKIFPNGFELNDLIKINGENLRIVGFYDAVGNPSDDSQIYVNLDFIDSLYLDSENNFGMIIARVDVSDMDNAVRNIEKSLRNSRDLEEGEEDFYVASFADMLESYTSALNLVVGFVLLIALISVLVSAINTANTMITSVLERVREIGVIKSIGARNSEILKIFLFESAFLGFVAGVLGVLLGASIAFVGGSILASLGYSFLKPNFHWLLFAGCILFATLTGAISGVVPAIRASRINPVDALRYE